MKEKQQTAQQPEQQTVQQQAASSSQRLNYYNYFTEVEETFVRRRGKHLHLGSIDWALIESWKEMGVPLHVVLSGIEHAFDSYDSRPRKRSVKTLMYCQEEVEAQYAEWLEAQVGAQGEETNGDGKASEDAFEETHLPFPRSTILEHMARARLALRQIREERPSEDQFAIALARVDARLCELEADFAGAARPNAEKLEASLTSLEKMLDEALAASLSPAELARARAETAAQLEPYRNRMERPTYEQTFAHLLLKRLRDQHAVPRLSLFYL